MLRRPKTDADPIREAEEAIARARADRDRIEAEAEEIRERLGRVGNSRASALLGDGDAETIAREARERRERLAAIEAETLDLTAAIGSLALRVVGLRAQAAATEKIRADLETASRQLELKKAAAAYSAIRQRHTVAEQASERANSTALHASLFASKVEKFVKADSPDPLVDAERERAAEEGLRAREHEQRIQAAIRNPGLLLQTPHLRAEVERRRPEFAAAEAERRELADAHGERLGHFSRREG
jgi:hypothetical protein